MAISYLSKPVAPTVVPYQEPVELIINVAQQQQSRYDAVLSQVFSQENSLMNLDTYNNDVTARKNALVRKMDEGLTKMIASDFSNPDTIRKAENLFQPIISDELINKDLYYSKLVKENQQIAKDVFKKDPSLGNKQNMQVSESLNQQYKNASFNDMDEAANYIGMFAPYVDVKAKISKTLKELGVLDGDTFEVNYDVNGEVTKLTTKGVVTSAEVMAKVNNALTSEDRYQLMLDGYYRYGNAPTENLISSLKNYDAEVTKEAPLKIKAIEDKLKFYDSDGNGKLDDDKIKSVNAGDYMVEFENLMSQKNYYSTIKEQLKSRRKFIDKYDKTKTLSIGDKLELSELLATDDMLGSLSALFEDNDGSSKIWSFSNAKAYEEANRNERFLISEQNKLDIANARNRGKNKDEEEVVTLDIDGDGAADFVWNQSQGYNVEPATITEDYASGLKNIKPIQNITRADGTKFTFDLSGTNITDYEAYFYEQMKEGSININDFIKGKLDLFAYDGKKIDPKKSEEINNIYEQFKSQAEKLKLPNGAYDEAKINTLIKDFDNRYTSYGAGIGSTFNTLMEEERSAKTTGGALDIKKLVNNYLVKKYFPLIETAGVGTGKLSEFMEKDEMKEIFEGIRKLYPRPNAASVDDVLNKISEIEIDKAKLKEMGASKYFMQYILPIIQSTAPDLVNRDENRMKIQNAIFDNLDVAKNYMKAMVHEKQMIYENLINSQSGLVLTVPRASTTDQKEDPLFKKIETAFIGAVGQPETYTFEKWNGKKKQWEVIKNIDELAANKFAINSFKYDTSNGYITAVMTDSSLVRVDAGDGKLPVGIPPDDILGKTLVADALIAGKDGGRDISKSVYIATMLNTGDAINIAYDGTSKSFIAFFNNDIANPIDSDNSTVALRSRIGQILSQYKSGKIPQVAFTQVEEMQKYFNQLKIETAASGSDYRVQQEEDVASVINIYNSEPY